eukprot:10679107-Heterocapsa_arctica.AAC.1
MGLPCRWAGLAPGRADWFPWFGQGRKGLDVQRRGRRSCSREQHAQDLASSHWCLFLERPVRISSLEER